MFRTILLATAVSVCAVAPALAAPAHDWTGFYAGVNAGLGGDQFTYPVNGTYTNMTEELDPDTSTNLTGKASLTSSGFLGGGQVGYDQAIDNWVLGAVADVDGSTVQGKASVEGSASGVGDASAHIGSKLDYFGTVRARLGLPIEDGRFMPYITAGMAYGQVTSSIGATYTPSDGSATTYSASRSNTQMGWTAGAGADFAVTDHVRFGVEYLYADLGTQTVLSGSTGLGGLIGAIDGGDGSIAGRIRVHATDNVIRATMNYQF